MSNRKAHCGGRQKRGSCEKRKCHIEKLKVDHLTTNTLTSVTTNTDTLNAVATNTEQLFINNKLFPSSTVPIPISSTTTITQSGKYVLAASFTGKITIKAANVDLNLANLTLTNVGDYALEILDSTITWVHGGFIESPDHTAIHVDNSYNPAFRDIYSVASPSVMLATNCNSMFLKNMFVQNVTDFAFNLINCPNLFVTVVNVSSIATFTGFLFRVADTDIMLLRNITFQKIVASLSGVRSSLLIENSFDILVTNVSSFTNEFDGDGTGDLSYYETFVRGCGDVRLSQIVASGDAVIGAGAFATKFNGIRVEDSYNVQINGTFADTSVTADALATVIESHMIHIETTPTGPFGCDNFQVGTYSNSNSLGGGTSGVTERNFCTLYGNANSSVPGSKGGGNWKISNSQANACTLSDGSDGKVCGFEVLDVDSTVKFFNVFANNNGSANNSETVGFKALGSFDTIVQFNTCSSNENSGNNLVASFLSSFNNTLINACFGCNNNLVSAAPGAIGCFGTILPGSVTPGGIQQSPNVQNSSMNNNEVIPPVAGVLSHGLFAGQIDLGDGLTQGVSDLTVSNSYFSNNSSGNGISMVSVNIAYLDKNTATLNDFSGFSAVGGSQLYLDNNFAAENTTGYDIQSCPFSTIDRNAASNNDVAFSDTTAGGNAYTKNRASNNITTDFNLTGGIAPVFELDKATGVFSFVSGNPDITAFTNIVSV